MGDLTLINDQHPRYATAFTLHPQCSNESVLQICIQIIQRMYSFHFHVTFSRVPENTGHFASREGIARDAGHRP